MTGRRSSSTAAPTLSEERARLCAAPGRRRLSAGAALAGSLSSGRRSRTRGTGAISPPGSPNGQANTPKLTGWVEENIEETLTFHRLPRQHHKHPKSTNMRERLNEEIKRRSHVVRIFPNGESCWRLVRALAIETHENWLEQHRCLNMDDRREHKEEALRRAA